MDIFEKLRHEHEQIRIMLERVAVTTEETPTVRKESVGHLRTTLEQHMVVEQNVLYATLDSYEQGHPLAAKGRSEHETLFQQLEELERLPLNHDEWGTTFRLFEERLRHHLQEEERERFGRASRILSQKQNDYMAERLDCERERIFGGR